MATGTERDRVLKGVFGFELVDAMYQTARGRREAGAGDIRGLEHQLARLGEDRETLGSARGNLEGLERRLGELQRIAPEVTELTRLEAEARQTLAAVGEQRRSLAELEQQIPSADRVHATAEALSAASWQVATAEAAVREAHDGARAAEQHLTETEGLTGSVEHLARTEGRIVELRREQEAARGAERNRQALEAAAAAKAAEREDLGRRIQALEQQHRQVVDEHARATVEVEERRRQLASAGDPMALQEARRLLLEAGHQQQELSQDRQRREVARKRADEAAEVLATRRDQLQQAEERRAAAALEVEGQAGRRAEAERVLGRAKETGMALALREHLHLGEPCPVCEQEVKALPRQAGSPAVREAEAALEQTRERLALAREALGAEERATVKCSQQVEHAEHLVADAGERLADLGRSMAEREHSVEAKLERIRRLMGAGEPAALLAAAEQALEAAQQALRAAEEREREVESRLRQNEQSLSVARAEEQAAARSLEEARGRAEQAGRDAEAAQAKARATETALCETLGPGDPEQLLAQARARLEQALRAVEQARQREREVQQALADHRAAFERVRAQYGSLTGQLATLAGSLGHRADGSAEPTLVELSRMVRELVAAQHDRLTSSEREASRAVDRQRREREQQLLSVGLEANAELQQALEQARVARDTERNRVEDLEARLAGAEELEQQLERARGRHALMATLTSDLAAGGFLTYLLDEERKSLAELGSERFQMLSGGRYRFADDGSFNVVDLASAGHVREARTLSGGETFLASLALALALAERVNRRGGRLDAFFLDEGFGSLDQEHLTLALDGIERLVVDSPTRLVAVVSHVEALRDRVEDLIELDKDPLTGATVVLRGARAG